jgi:ABC-type multidrug transport system permease subunit
MRNLAAIYAAFIQHWKSTTSNYWSLAFFIASVPQVAIYAWMAIQNPNPAVLAYLIIGAPLFAIWHSVFFGITGALNSEIRSGTIEFTMISRTSMLVALFGKALAMMVFGIPVGIVSVAVMLMVSRQMPHIASYPYTMASIFFIFIGLAATGLVMMPIVALTRGRSSGMYTPLIPIIVTLSGFLFPVSNLPAWLGVISRILPSSWAMESILQSVKGPDSPWAVMSGWVYCILLSAVMFVFTYLLFRQVEKRFRIDGLMSY